MSVGELHQRSFEPSGVQIIFAWFHRVIALYCLLFGVLYWIRLIGIYDGRAVALRPDAGALAGDDGRARRLLSVRRHRTVDDGVVGAGDLVHLRRRPKR